MHFRDAEHLSEYLDGRLTAADAARLEARLAVDEGLRRLLDDLRVARGLMRRVPRRRAPRNFTLSPLNSRVRAPQPRAVPALRFAGAIASFLFTLSLAANALAPLATSRLAAGPAPGFGMGGAVGGGAPEPEVPPETMTMPVLGTPEAGAAPLPQDLSAPTAEAFAKTAPPAESAAPGARQGAKSPVPAVWIMVLAILGTLFVGFSWYLDARTRRNFHSRLVEK